MSLHISDMKWLRVHFIVKNQAIMLLLASLLIPAMPLRAQAMVAPNSDDSSRAERWSFLTTIGEEQCPQSSGDEIVVCAEVSESDRYRIPKNLRQTQIETASAQSWTSVVETLDDGARAGRPGSCSAVGSYGFTGCLAAALRQWFAERR